MAGLRRHAVAALALLLAARAHAAAPAPRVVTLAPSLAELVCAAGACKALVGVSDYTDYPAAAAKIERVGGATGFSLETILALRPTLILAWRGGTDPRTVSRLRGLGLTVRWVQVDRLDAIAGALRHIGDWLGTTTVADAAARRYSRRLAALRRQYANASRLRVFYQIGTEPAYTVNRRSTVSQALAVCGGVNVFADLPRIADPVSAEAVMHAAPQAVFYGRDEPAAPMHAYWARLGSVPAARHHALFRIDADLLARPGPRLIDGIEAVCTDLDRLRGRLSSRLGRAEAAAPAPDAGAGTRAPGSAARHRTGSPAP